MEIRCNLSQHTRYDLLNILMHEKKENLVSISKRVTKQEVRSMDETLAEDKIASKISSAKDFLTSAKIEPDIKIENMEN